LWEREGFERNAYKEKQGHTGEQRSDCMNSRGGIGKTEECGFGRRMFQFAFVLLQLNRH